MRRGNEAGGQGKNIERIIGEAEVRIKDGNIVDCDGVELIYT